MWSLPPTLCYSISICKQFLIRHSQIPMDGRDPRGVISIVNHGWIQNEPLRQRTGCLRSYWHKPTWLKKNGISHHPAFHRASNNKSLSTFARLQEPWAAFQAHQYWSAIKRCKSIRSKYPKSDEAIDCLMLIGMSHGEIGHIRSSKQFFDQYLAAVPASPFQESLALLQAEYTYRLDKDDGFVLLYSLYFHHQYPTTDVKIQEILGGP